MKTNVQFKLLGLLVSLFAIFSSIFLSNCKGHVEIFEITDSIVNCSPPYVVYFYPDAEHRTKDLEYTWDFGDGTAQSHEKEPVHIYHEKDVYQVTLSIKQNKSFDSKTKTLHLSDDSTQTYSDWDYATYAGSLWAPSQVEFLNYSKFATTFLWDFGDGDSSYVKEPIHVYQSPGAYLTTLNAICDGDTSKFTREMLIKPPPKTIDINDVTIWMPNTYIGTDVWVEIWYAGYNEVKSALVRGVSSFPVTINIEESLFWFSGDFNNDLLEFELWSSINDGNPEKMFDISSAELQNNYYPSVIGRDDGYGYAYEAQIGYRD